MMRLELKHLAPYLPYGLKGINTAFNSILNIKAVYDDLCIISSYNHLNNTPVPLSNINPILRPLSDLTKEIDINGEKFVTINEIHKINHKIYIYKPTNYDLEITIDTEDFSQEIDLYDGYLVMQKLLEYHFDVFGLIEQGLAININTLCVDK